MTHEDRTTPQYILDAIEAKRTKDWEGLTKEQKLEKVQKMIDHLKKIGAIK